MGILSNIAVIAGLLQMAGVTRTARGANRVAAEEHRGSFSFRDPESAGVLPAGAAGSGEAGGLESHSLQHETHMAPDRTQEPLC